MTIAPVRCRSATSRGTSIEAEPDARLSVTDPNANCEAEGRQVGRRLRKRPGDREREAGTERREPRTTAAPASRASAIRRTRRVGRPGAGGARRPFRWTFVESVFESGLPDRLATAFPAFCWAHLRRGFLLVEQFNAAWANRVAAARQGSRRPRRDRAARPTIFQMAARLTCISAASAAPECSEPSASRPSSALGACCSSRPGEPEPARAVLDASAHPLDVRAMRVDDERGHHIAEHQQRQRESGRGEREVHGQCGAVATIVPRPT